MRIMNQSVERLNAVTAKVAAAEQERGTGGEPVTLVAVSKTWSADEIRPVIEAGARVFGENKVQEAKDKWPGLKEQYSGLEVRLLGPLQTNKVRDAVALFDVIETVDREKLAAELAKEIRKQGRAPRLYVQVNTGREPQKAGIDPDEAVAFVTRCRDLHGLEVEGLMCIPPAGEDPAPHFDLLARLTDEAGLERRSMGMSGDYETAIRHGASSVRVGSAIFGSRTYA
jgi:pyridoxal phosphate enzyme (YggS family)